MKTRRNVLFFCLITFLVSFLFLAYGAADIAEVLHAKILSATAAKDDAGLDFTGWRAYLQAQDTVIRLTSSSHLTEISVGDIFDPTYTVEHASGKLETLKLSAADTIAFSNDRVLEVRDSHIVAVAPGTVTVTLTRGDLTLAFPLTVTTPITEL